MLSIVKRPTAQKDVKNIWSYTYQQWGEPQANRYLAGLNKSVMALAENPSLGRSIQHVRAGYLRYRYQNHFIVYRYTEDTLEIFRILHERMDIAQHRLQ